jgi:hypothetical protein
LVTYGQDDVALEQAVSRLSLEPGVTLVRWRVAEPLVTDPLSGPIGELGPPGGDGWVVTVVKFADWSEKYVANHPIVPADDGR